MSHVYLVCYVSGGANNHQHGVMKSSRRGIFKPIVIVLMMLAFSLYIDVI